MSDGYYQLLSSDSRDSDDYGERPRFKRSLSRNFLSRLTSWASSIIRSITRSRSRHGRSYSEPGCSTTAPIRSSRRRRLIWFIIAIIILTAIIVSNWDILGNFYYEQFLMLLPGPACLVDPSSAASYVHWDPKKKNYGPLYHCIQQPIRPASKNVELPGSSLRGFRPLPDWCMEGYYTNGSTCNDAERTQFDIIWTWVNGSDPMISRARARAMAALTRGDDYDSEDDVPEESEEEEKKNAHLYT